MACVAKTSSNQFFDKLRDGFGVRFDSSVKNTVFQIQIKS